MHQLNKSIVKLIQFQKALIKGKKSHLPKTLAVKNFMIVIGAIVNKWNRNKDNPQPMKEIRIPADFRGVKSMSTFKRRTDEEPIKEGDVMR